MQINWTHKRQKKHTHYKHTHTHPIQAWASLVSVQTTIAKHLFKNASPLTISFSVRVFPLKPISRSFDCILQAQAPNINQSNPKLPKLCPLFRARNDELKIMFLNASSFRGMRNAGIEWTNKWRWINIFMQQMCVRSLCVHSFDIVELLEWSARSKVTKTNLCLDGINMI